MNVPTATTERQETVAAEEYAAALEQYLRTYGEDALYQASLLSKRCVALGMGPDDLIALHSEAHDLVANQLPPLERLRAVNGANQFLLEVMIGFGMHHKERARLEGALLVARTVAHEINNALSPIVGYSELLALNPKIAGEPTLAAYAQLILHAGEQVAQKIQRLQRIVRLEEATDVFGPSQPVLDLDRSTSERP